MQYHTRCLVRYSNRYISQLSRIKPFITVKSDIFCRLTRVSLRMAREMMMFCFVIKLNSVFFLNSLQTIEFEHLSVNVQNI